MHLSKIQYNQNLIENIGNKNEKQKQYKMAMLALDIESRVSLAANPPKTLITLYLKKKSNIVQKVKWKHLSLAIWLYLSFIQP